MPEIALVSDDKVYIFKVRTSYRVPGPASMFVDKGVNLDNLGYEAFITGDSIKPGKYRIALIFKNPSTGEAYYWDKPARYFNQDPQYPYSEINPYPWSAGVTVLILPALHESRLWTIAPSASIIDMA